MKEILEKIIFEASKAKNLSEQSFGRIKREHMRELNIHPVRNSASNGVHGLPSNINLISVYQKLLKTGKIKANATLAQIIKKRKVRTLSGIASITVLTKNWGCPGKCAYCPTEKDMPKSYLSNEPAVMRAIANEFDPIRQTRSRLESLKAQGHSIDKIEIIVIGGTWSAIPRDYQEWYIQKLYEALNDRAARSLKAAQAYNTRYAKHKLVGLTLETRPDWVTEEEIKKMREYGCTRVELGVQSLYDDVLDISNRGHHIEQTARATKMLKDAGFKINYHMMLNLPGSTPKKDIAMFKELFANPDFRPDMLKIYPCMVIKGTKLHEQWKRGKYKPYTDRQLINIIKKAKQYVPEYCRIVRVIRDIPAESIEAGSKASNLRQTIHEEMKKEGLKCRCIRCREIGNIKLETRNLKLKRLDYEASDGKEIFLSFEDIKHDKLAALLRLRIIDCHSRESGNPVKFEKTAIIRELHTYGEAVPLFRGRDSKHTQHRGLGKLLVKEAEKVAGKEFGARRITVISGVGVRGYYTKLGYKLRDTYMVKKLR